jgi:cation diffusion facilitator CzcD-associated flavoprotein CzcO
MAESSNPQPERCDVVIVGAGILGIHSLYEYTLNGFSVISFEQGSGPGGAWYWNRYPQARFDSESYTYAYLFDKELFDDWEWSEHFASQPEIERYMNHVVDRFDLRRHIRFNNRVVSAVWNDDTETWTVTAADGTVVESRFFIPSTGVLSVPYIPETEGTETFQGIMSHTGLWPKEGIDFNGKRVAVIGTGASGAQLIPAIAPVVGSMTVYQRGANWCTPLNNRPITAAEQAELRANFESFRHTVLNSITGFLHQPSGIKGVDASYDEREAHFEKMWTTPGFGKLIRNYSDFMRDPVVNKHWCDFVSAKIRARVNDPETADKLIPKDHHFGGKRPPMETNYYEAYNNPNVSLIDLHANPIARITETGIETADGVHQEFDVIIWATGFDFGTGALRRIDIRGRDGEKLAERWSRGPLTFTGTMSHGFPNMFFPGGPHGTGGNNPRYGGDQVEFARDMILFMRDNHHTSIEITKEMEDEWMDMIEQYTQYAGFVKDSFFMGGNIPGKPLAILQNPAGRDQMMNFFAKAKDNDHQGFTIDRRVGDAQPA